VNGATSVEINLISTMKTSKQLSCKSFTEKKGNFGLCYITYYREPLLLSYVRHLHFKVVPCFGNSVSEIYFGIFNTIRLLVKPSHASTRASTNAQMHTHAHARTHTHTHTHAHTYKRNVKFYV